MEQRVVYVEKAHSYLMVGDPEIAVRYRVDHHDALPMLLSEGWTIDSIAPVGEAAAYFVLSRETPPPPVKATPTRKPKGGAD
jgi:hypothetical protein